MRTQLRLLTLLALLPGCAKDGSEGEESAPARTTLTGPAAVEAMKEAGAELLAKPEHDAQEIEVQHLLVSFRGAIPGPTRSKEAAETLAGELYARVVAGEDFDTLVREHTNDSYPGFYAMTLGPATKPGEWARNGMVAAFGDTGWRLAVGEVGVALFDPQKSPFGWHIVKRTR